MTDTSDDPSTEGKGPRGWTVLLITGAVVAALAGGGIAIDRLVLRHDDEPATVESAPVTDDTVIDVEPVSASPTRLFARTTADGVEVRVNESTDDIWGMGFAQGDDLPGWCTVQSTLSVTALSTDAVAQSQFPRTDEPPPDIGPMLSVGGMVEQSPLVLVVAQVDDTVTSARLSQGGATVDTMEPIDGLVALAITLPGPDPDPDAPTTTFGPSSSPWGVDLDGVAVEFVHADGTTDRKAQQQLWNNAIPIWSDPQCQPGMVGGTVAPPTMPELKLPKVTGTQPADPAAERALIEANLRELYDHFSDTDTLFSLVDDASGIDLLMVGLMREYGSAYRKMDAEVIDLVFFSPVEASFVYTTGLDVWSDGFSGDTQQYGRARLVDGVWRITRSTVCQDIARAGMTCTI
jgi:hypothetical protein